MDDFDLKEIAKMKKQIAEMFANFDYTEGYRKGVDDTLVYFSKLLKNLQDDDFVSFFMQRQGS